jgi:AraC family transcriptional regulator, regulatory protein of adaptative response / DNA-3-methyladenine glycosylase II
MKTEQIHNNFDLCYRAILSRDVRFDGRFFTAVTSTGIYCRPICPARTPQAKNVRFYACAAAAEAAGFRACRRCRPETSPGSPDWNIRADLTARALRLIADGVVDSEGVAGLAGRLAVSERHLHRELVAEVGAGPLALARTRRAQTARLLIDTTDLSLTTIAFTAGFSSIRQFNDTMQTSFGCPPSALRRSAPTSNGDAGKLVLHLSYRPPFESAALFAFLGRRALPGVEEVGASCYRRTVALGETRGIVEVELQRTRPALVLRLQLNRLQDIAVLVQRCRSLFDLDADPLAIHEVLEGDPVLAPLIAAHPGLRLPGTVDGFEVAVRAILGQQVSLPGARTLIGRLVQKFGEPLAEADGALTHFFPTPEVIAQANLEGLGITSGRTRALRVLAEQVSDGRLVLERCADREEVETRLLELPGVGAWTASYIAMRALGDPDAFPASDLGLRRALEAHGLDSDVKSITEHAQAWRPWRGYATMHLWSEC